MTCGEVTTSNVKYKDPVSIPWKAPFFICCNELPSDFRSDTDGIPRRARCFPFDEIVPENVRNEPNFDQRLIEQLPYMIIVAASAHLEAVQLFGSGSADSFFNKLICFKSLEMEQACMNDLMSFLIDTSQTVCAADKFCPYNEFKEAFLRYQNQTGGKKDGLKMTLHHMKTEHKEILKKYKVSIKDGERRLWKNPYGEERFEPREEGKRTSFLLGVDLVPAAETAL